VLRLRSLYMSSIISYLRFIQNSLLLKRKCNTYINRSTYETINDHNDRVWSVEGGAWVSCSCVPFNLKDTVELVIIEGWLNWRHSSLLRRIQSVQYRRPAVLVRSILVLGH